MSPFLKKYLHWAGSIVAVTGMVFVVFRLFDYGSQLDISRFNTLMWFVLSGFALIYGLANILLALAWRSLLVYFAAPTSRLWAIKIYGLTQLAKYIPGNIMHLAGRQAMGQAAGVDGWSLAKASMWELGLISITGFFFSLLVLPQFFPVVPMATMVAFIITLLIIHIGLRRYVSVFIMRAFGFYVIFLLISGLIFVGVLVLLMNENFIGFPQIFILCGAFVIAWLVGLITPGAPAGAGVRELVLIVLLKGTVLESDLLLAVMLSRMVTVCGDISYFLLAFFFLNRIPNLYSGER